MENNKEYILCSAIKRKEPRNGSPYWEGKNDIMNIEIGYRHHDIIHRFGDELSRHPQDQGFYTSNGRFVDRIEAMCVAWRAGQVSNGTALKSDLSGSELNVVMKAHFNDEMNIDKSFFFNKLYSEDLY